MKLKVSKLAEDPPISPNQMAEWNGLLDFIKSKGYEGSEKLDKRDHGLWKSLFDEYKRVNPNATITYDIVPKVQTEMQKLRDSAQAFAERRKDPNAKNIMANVSKVDGWLGSKTSQFRFPDMTLKQVHNNTPVSSVNLGLVGAGLTPTANLAAMRNPLPKGVKLQQMEDGEYYEDPKTGDLVKYR